MCLIRLLVVVQINYAESTVECRRLLIMHHFGEASFSADLCRGTCDVCLARGTAQVAASPSFCSKHEA